MPGFRLKSLFYIFKVKSFKKQQTFCMKTNIKFLALAGLLVLTTGLNAEGLIRFYENYKVGYKDATGHVVVPAKYYAGSEFINGYAIVVDDNQKRGFLNEKGEVAIPLQYSDVGPFANGVARVQLNKKYGYINTEGKWLLEPKYDFAEDFADGFAVVAINGKYGFINTDFKEAIALNYEKAKKFSNGLAPAQQDKLWGYINNKGEWEIKAQYESANFFNGNKEAQVSMNHEFYVINDKGTVLKKIEMKHEEEFERHRNAKKGEDKDKD